MFDGLRLYLRYITVSIRSQMQYRASFIMMSIGNFITTGVEFLGIWALFDRFGSLKSWSLWEVALLYGMINVSFAVAESIGRGFDTFPSRIRSGEFDRMLLRPRSTVLQVAGQEMQWIKIGRLSQGLFLILIAVSRLSVEWNVAKVLLLVGAIAGGASLFYGIFVIQATISFWTIETLELFNTVTYGGVEAAQYPLSIYRKWFRRFFLFVIPLGCANYLPFVAITGAYDPLGVPKPVSWLSPIVGILFLLISLQVWRIGVRSYQSTGS